MPDYRSIFGAVESTLLRVGSQHVAVEKIQKDLDEYKLVEGKGFSDSDYYRILVYVVFYSGFRAATVDARSATIDKYFSDFRVASSYGPQDIDRILQDPEMIKNRRKVRACVENAQTFKEIVSQHGSFQGYIDSFAPKASSTNLMRLKRELQHRFVGLGRVTTFHVLTDIGMPVLKPDRVMCRVFKRFGLVANEKDIEGVVKQGGIFVEHTGHPIRYIDIVFVTFGQLRSTEFGLDRGICLEKNPRCSLCGGKELCTYDGPAC